MKLLKDTTGVIYELFDQPNGKVRLQCQQHGKIAHDYSKPFIESAIQAGALIPVEGKENHDKSEQIR